MSGNKLELITLSSVDEDRNLDKIIEDIRSNILIVCMHANEYHENGGVFSDMSYMNLDTGQNLDGYDKKNGIENSTEEQ